MRFAPHPITLRQLQYIVAVADRTSFRKAAADCHVSQPSLSAQLAQAEDALGVRLFDRNKRRVVLTPAGEAIVTRARALLLSADELVASAAQMADPFAGTVRLGIIPTIGPYFLPDIAPRLKSDYPRLTETWVEDRTEALMARLHEGELEGAVVALEAKLGEVEHAVIGEDPFVLATPFDDPLGRGRRRVSASELDGQAVLLLDDGHCFRDQALAFCAKAGADELAVRATSLPTLVQMVAGGAGVTLLPSLAISVENRRESLRIRRFSTGHP